MAKTFYLRLAAANLARNKRMYGPYVVAVAIISGIFFIILNLVLSQSISNLSYGGTVVTMFLIGIVVMSLFTVGYMLYINSFLIKRRRREFGLYAVLGMEKRHVARLILWEGLMLYGLGMVLGLIGGAVFGRLVFAGLMNMLDTARGSTYVLSGTAALLTLTIFGVVFIVATLYNLNQVRLASPVELMRSERRGEKKMRFTWLAALVGAAMLGTAYYMAITTRNSAMALLKFWPAVILVIIATWLLFAAGSVFILGRLQRSKRIYYRPRNFITISGLTHRMKQNAAGLANICILSTMVLVTVSCCISLFLGQDAIVRRQLPDDIQFDLRLADSARQADIVQETRAEAEVLAQTYQMAPPAMRDYQYFGETLLLSGGELVYHDAAGALDYTADEVQAGARDVHVVPLQSFNRATGQALQLQADEAMVLTSDRALRLTEIPMQNGALTVARTITDSPLTVGKNSDSTRLLFVVADEATALRLAKSINPTRTSEHLSSRLIINVDAPDNDTGLAYSAALRDSFVQRTESSFEAIGQDGFYRTNDIFRVRINGYALYGGLLFLGVFFAILFLVNTVLILYFKQISEGFEDAERFAILQKVGLSDQEVRSTVNRQMLIVFLAPLVVALLHIAAASNMIQQMLMTFMLTDFQLTLRCILVTSAVFVVAYLIMYRLTARTYYRLVRW